jgi:hypothetical protein
MPAGPTDAFGGHRTTFLGIRPAGAVPRRVDEDWKGDERLMLRARSRFLVRGVLVGAGALLALVAAGGPVGAQPQVSDQDRQYLVQAHQGNLAEIAAGRLAQTKGAANRSRISVRCWSPITRGWTPRCSR